MSRHSRGSGVIRPSALFAADASPSADATVRPGLVSSDSAREQFGALAVRSTMNSCSTPRAIAAWAMGRTRAPAPRSSHAAAALRRPASVRRTWRIPSNRC